MDSFTLCSFQDIFNRLKMRPRLLHFLLFPFFFSSGCTKEIYIEDEIEASQK